jgi:hypothetical protein
MSESKEEMEEMATKFFKDLYTADQKVQPDIITDNVQTQISQEMNERLCKDYSDDEIGNAPFQIGPLKAPGKDGFQQDSCNDIGESSRMILLLLLEISLGPG